MQVELVYAAGLERRAHPRVEVVREGRGAGPAGRLAAEVGELLAFEQARPERRSGAAASGVTTPARTDADSPAAAFVPAFVSHRCARRATRGG